MHVLLEHGGDTPASGLGDLQVAPDAAVPVYEDRSVSSQPDQIRAVGQPFVDEPNDVRTT
jgi:hypothetical protein